MRILLTSLLILISSYSFSQNKQNEMNITGWWADSNSTNFTNGAMLISQLKNVVTIVHYVEFNGTSMVEEGKGTILKNKVQYKVIVSKSIPGWSVEGEHFLTLSNDGKTLRGIYKDNKGNVGPLVFKRVR